MEIYRRVAYCVAEREWLMVDYTCVFSVAD